MRNFLSGRRVRERRETETFCGSVSTRRSGFKKPRRRKRFAVSTRTPRWIARTNRLERYGQASGASRFTRDESARRRSPRRTPSRPCVHRHDGRVLDLPRRRGGARSDVRVEDHRLCVRQGASRRARDGRSRPPRAAILPSCITTRELTRKPNASDARRGARGGRLFFRRAAHRASPETWRRPRRRVASSTREARHPAARPADREDAGKLPTAAVAKPPDKISLPASGTVASGVRLVLSLRVFFAISPSRVVLVVAADPSTRPSLPFARPAARSPRQRSRSSARRRPPPPRRLRSSP